ncbi:hypothetical protein [Bowmanella dokdonensis]|uniref:Haem-binding uptake Tiki superfamily ChaN domain-containing protein n=1 Tax=Bowmanella dokdonensis TaxID=751969 RepID=A0A939INY0_9ALTE|nr:hypothetical protein [Bowmanella dokdonensis]MBN7826843.1 hypothetical protein [Bowmanella dokdonensis]
MRTLWLVFLNGLVLFSPWSQADDSPTVVAVVAAMHGFHRDHPSYSYQQLYDYIASLQPDSVGVEIRSEDMAADKSYLAKNYPAEMIELAGRYGQRAFGFDWLGNAIAGQPIPADYWQHLEVKKLERQLAKDASFQSSRPVLLEKLQQQQMALLQSATAELFPVEQYGQLTRRIDKLYADWLEHSPYGAIEAFNRERDRQIAENIIAFVSQHPGQRIVLVMGADHQTFAIEALEKHFGDSIEWLSPRP